MKKNKGMCIAALCLLLMLLPAMAMAEIIVSGNVGSWAEATDDDGIRTLTITGNGVTISGSNAINSYEWTQTCIVVEEDVKTLTLDNVNIRNAKKSVLTVMGDLTLKVTGTQNKLKVDNVSDNPVIDIANGHELTIQNAEETGGEILIEANYGVTGIQGDLILNDLSAMSVKNAGIDGNVTVNGSGTHEIQTGVLGDVTVSSADAKLKLKGFNYSIDNIKRAALEGGLNVTAGSVILEGCYQSSASTGFGAILTKDSKISGGVVIITGGDGNPVGSPALTRRDDAKLTVSGGALTLEGGVYRLTYGNTASPDYNKPAAAIADEDADMLVWSSPVQMRTYNYKPDGSYKDQADAFAYDDLKGKSIIQSLIGWVVTYKPNGGMIAQGRKAQMIVEDNGIHTVDVGAFVREGYSLLNWDVDMGGQTPQDQKNLTVTANTVITANWKINRYTIRFDTDGGSRIEPITQDYGTAVTMPADPTKEGYTFVGWDQEIPSVMPAGDLKITAIWQSNSAGAENLPKTGDPDSLLGWAALLGASGAGAKVLRRRKK